MQGLPTRTVRWMLFSDLHFKHHDLNRVWQTAKWIVAEAERHQVRRVVVCGDLLTSRTMQPTHVLSTCYRFIGLLSDIIPHVHILLGNHDLAYRRDYQTTALDAFNLNRLAPSLHEDQSGLTDAVASLSPTEASKTVAFAHLAINKAITQRHQTITQKQPNTNKTDLRGSITYLGSPLQLNWSDLYDEKRGILLFDPETLEHEMLINPYVIGYTTVNLQEVLNDQANEEALKDKHVMLLGDLSHLKYVMARQAPFTWGAECTGLEPYGL
ncbi:hypothetical protein SNK05_013607 [Fusarium graminearum]